MYCMAVYLRSNHCNGRRKLGGLVFWKTHHMYRYKSLVLLREGNLEYVCRVPLKLKVSYQSSSTSHEMSISETSISFQETSVSSLKKSVWSRKTREWSRENHLSTNFGICYERSSTSLRLRTKMTTKLSCQSAVVIKLET